ncbi:hypothetical protein ECZU18_44210 [Escherichia coli]|nr:hypothetical protein ECZU18_44210 [Escherichia coli]
MGKTETVLQLAELLYGGRQYLTTINMSEFQEKHTVSRLIGSPPGYVGYGEGGVLTEAIRQKPYSVVLLDEVEKAHPDVLNLFYQAFDKGEMADGEGRLIDCKNIVFFLTSNLGYQVIVEHADDPETMQEVLYPVLADFFKPALLARMEVVPYLPLSKETLATIIAGKLARTDNVLRSRFGAEVIIEPEVTDEIMSRVTRAENGARMLESVIDGNMLPPLSCCCCRKWRRIRRLPGFGCRQWTAHLRQTWKMLRTTSPSQRMKRFYEQVARFPADRMVYRGPDDGLTRHCRARRSIVNGRCGGRRRHHDPAGCDSHVTGHAVLSAGVRGAGAA